MSDNAQKLHAARALNKIGEDRANAHAETLSKGVPCTVTKVSGGFVTVKLEMKANSVALPEITIPQHFAEWTRDPTQVGDKGRAIPADYHLGGQSGAGGMADLYPRFNLTSLVFHPVAQKAFSAWDGMKHLLNGPNGAVLQTKDGSVKVDVDKASGAVTITGDLKVTGNIMAASGDPMTSVDVLNHVHTGVMAGGATTQKPVAGS